MKFVLFEIINSDSKIWVEILSALLTPLIALLVALIAWLQWKTSKAQVKNELFDKRYAIFEAAKTFIITFLQLGEVREQDFQQFVSKTKGATFIFSNEISIVIKEIEDKAWKHKCNLELRETQQRGGQTWEWPTKENTEIFNWFKNTLMTIDKTFKKDLQLGVK